MCTFVCRHDAEDLCCFARPGLTSPCGYSRGNTIASEGKWTTAHQRTQPRGWLGGGWAAARRRQSTGRQHIRAGPRTHRTPTCCCTCIPAGETTGWPTPAYLPTGSRSRRSPCRGSRTSAPVRPQGAPPVLGRGPRQSSASSTLRSPPPRRRRWGPVFFVYSSGNVCGWEVLVCAGVCTTHTNMVRVNSRFAFRLSCLLRTAVTLKQSF